MSTVGVIDYGVGNLRSILNAIEHVGGTAKLVSRPDEIYNFEKLVLPGVGSFNRAMSKFLDADFLDPLTERVIEGRTPLLGICVGMQILAQSGTERMTTKGLGFINGSVDIFDQPECPQEKFKIPHVGFNSVQKPKGSRLFSGLQDTSDFYFTHSYRLIETTPEAKVGLCDYGVPFVASVEFENIAGTQFHPEKSQSNGLRLIRNFLEYY